MTQTQTASNDSPTEQEGHAVTRTQPTSKPIRPRAVMALAAMQATGAGVQNGQNKRKDTRAIRRRGKAECSRWE